MDEVGGSSSVGGLPADGGTGEAGVGELGVQGFWGGLTSGARKAIIGAGGVVFFVILFIIVRACGGGGGSGYLMLVRESSGDLYIVEAGEEVGRENRVARDAGLVKLIAMAKGRGVSYVNLASVGDRLVLLAEAEGSDVLWSVDGGEYEEVLSSAGDLSAVVVDDVLYVRETLDGSRRCHRGGVGDLELVFRGNDCWFSWSGHLAGVNRSGEAFAVTVWSPAGEELMAGSFDVRPRLAQNGKFLVSVEESDLGVAVMSTDGGEEVWSLDDGYRAEFASSPSGHLAVASQTPGGGVVLVVVDGAGEVFELVDADGDVEAEFNDDGDLFWLELGFGRGDDVLSVWDASSGEARELAAEEGLRFVGVWGDHAVVSTEDDSGVCVGRFPPEGDCELHEMNDSTGLKDWSIVDGHLYLIGGSVASLVPLSGGTPVDFEPWDAVEFIDRQDGTLFATRQDGSSQVLFGLNPGWDKPREYGEYDSVLAAAATGGRLYVAATSGGVTTLAYDISTGEQIDDIEYRGYRLISNLELSARNRLYKGYLEIPDHLKPATPTTQPQTEHATDKPNHQ